MAVAYYGYLVLKMPSPNGVLKICKDCDAGVFAPEKLQALTTSHMAAAGLEGLDPATQSSLQCSSTFAPRMQPSNNEGVPVKTV
jgi:hypothetical protein